LQHGPPRLPRRIATTGDRSSLLPAPSLRGVLLGGAAGGDELFTELQGGAGVLYSPDPRVSDNGDAKPAAGVETGGTALRRAAAEHCPAGTRSVRGRGDGRRRGPRRADDPRLRSGGGRPGRPYLRR